MLFIAKVKTDADVKTQQHIFKRNICDQFINKSFQNSRDITWSDIKIFDSVTYTHNL